MQLVFKVDKLPAHRREDVAPGGVRSVGRYQFKSGEPVAVADEYAAKFLLLDGFERYEAPKPRPKPFVAEAPAPAPAKKKPSKKKASKVSG